MTAAITAPWTNTRANARPLPPISRVSRNSKSPAIRLSATGLALLPFGGPILGPTSPPPHSRAGDFNSSPDRHLGAAQPLLPAWCTGGGGGGPPTHGSSPSAAAPGWTPLQPDVLISEATYAATLRDSKRSRERDFLAAVIDTVTAGGKVREGAGP